MPVDIQRRLFTADDHQRMGQAGILGPEDRVELIEGEIVSMTPIGPRHNAAVARANKLFVTAAGDTAIVLTQGSVRLNLRSEPEPDIAILRPRRTITPHDMRVPRISCCCSRSLRHRLTSNGT
jgi:Uma2 family endonuclease